MTRTILYLYFKNKREIFTFSIKLFTGKPRGRDPRHRGGSVAKPVGQALAILAMVVETCAAHRRLLSVILDYLGVISARRAATPTIACAGAPSGRGTSSPVSSSSGQKRGTSLPSPSNRRGDLFYAFIEAAIFRIAVLGGRTCPASSRRLPPRLRFQGQRTQAQGATGSRGQAFAMIARANRVRAGARDCPPGRA